MSKILTIAEFIKEFEDAMMHDITDKEDCNNAWNAMIDAYEEDNLVNNKARQWKNPFLDKFNN